MAALSELQIKSVPLPSINRKTAWTIDGDAAETGDVPETDTVSEAALAHGRMLCRSLPVLGTKLPAPLPRDDTRFVQLQLTALLHGKACVAGDEAYRNLVVAGGATLLDTATAILQSFGLGDDTGTVRCIFEDILVDPRDGLTTENVEIPGLEWRKIPKRVFHPEKQLRALKIASLLDRPLFGRPRGERKKGGTRSHVSFLAKVEAKDPLTDATPRPRNGLYAFTVRCTAAGTGSSMQAKCQAALPRCVGAGGAALGGTRCDYDASITLDDDPTAIDAINDRFFTDVKKRDTKIIESFDEAKALLRAPLFNLDLAAEYAAKNDL